MQPATPPSGLPPQKKGMPVLGWVGIGCGTLLIITVLVVSLLVGWCNRKVNELAHDFKTNPDKAAAEMFIRFNPDLEVVSENDASGEMTIRTKDGKEVTFSYKDIAAGKFSVTDSDGNATSIGKTDLSEIPTWVPRIPDLTGEVVAFHNTSKQQTSGYYTATSTKSAAEIEEFLKAEASHLGLNSSSSSNLSINGIDHRKLSFSGNDRELSVNLHTDASGTTHAQIGYSEKTP